MKNKRMKSYLLELYKNLVWELSYYGYEDKDLEQIFRRDFSNINRVRKAIPKGWKPGNWKPAPIEKDK